MKCSNKLIHRFLFIIMPSIIFIIFTAPGYCQNYQQPDLDQALAAGINASDHGDYDTAFVEFTKAVTISESLYGRDHLQTALCYLNLGEVYYFKFDYDRAVFYFEEALGIRLKALDPEDPEVAVCYYDLGAAYQAKGNYDIALSNYKTALAIRLKSFGTAHPDVATSYNNLGLLYFQRNDYANAITCYEKALAIYLEVFDPEHSYVAISYNNLGGVYKAEGDYDRAISYYEKALDIRLKTMGSGHSHTANSYNNLGGVYFGKGDYLKAISYFEKALAIKLKALGPEHPDVAIFYSNLGTVYLERRDFDQAIAYFEKSLALKQQSLGPEHPGLAGTYNNLGGAYDSKGDYERAIFSYKKALDLKLKAVGPEHTDLATFYNNLGKTYDSEGKYDTAISYYQQALAIRAKFLGPSHPDVAMTYYNLGLAYYSKNDVDQAISSLEQALAFIRNTVSRQEMIMIASQLGLLAMAKKRYDQAQTYFQEGIETIEGKARFEMGAGKSEFMGRNLEIYRYALKNCVLMDDPAGAFRMAELMKERGFLDQLSLRAILGNEEIDPNDRNRALELTQAIESAVLSLQTEINKPESKQDKVRIVSLRDDLEFKENELTLLEKKILRNERYRNLRQPLLVTLENARALCDERTAILIYVLWNEKDDQKQPYCLVITKSGLKIIKLEKEFDYSQRVDEYRKAIIANDDERINQTSSALYTGLVSPLKGSLIGIKRLLIVPDGALAFLPFDALRNKDTGRYVGEDYLISLTPSVSVLSMIKQRNFSPKRNQFLAFGGAKYSKEITRKRGQQVGIPESGASEKLKNYYVQRSATEGMNGYAQAVGFVWPDLPGTLDEVKAIKTRFFKQKENKIIIGLDATEAQVKELSRSQELSKYRIIHFACHGYYNQDYPLLSAIVFSEVSGQTQSAEDGYLTVEDAALLNLNADIVNLSACQTGLGKIEEGNGVIGLTRAFQVAGANMVGVTLWTVDDEATKQFMITMYEKVYKNKKTYIEAYAETKREFMRSKKYSSPCYWSPFVLYGM